MISVGEQIGRYRVRSAIGKGGMGEVFLAEDTELERLVALKVLPEDLANDPERMRRFVQEAKSASALNHPNIITIHEIGKTDSTHFIATEYIEGETLHSRLKSEPMNIKSVLDVAVQVASALDASHRAGIVHRDIKPENIMIRPDGVVKILDFGIAKLTEKKAESIDAEAATTIKAQGTSPGMIIGTASYMSPEQARGKDVDARSDIFSFGVVLYEMLSGKQPFDGENAIDTISAIINKEPASLRQLIPDIPRELQHIVEKSLRKDREERYQTARDLLIDLKDIKQDLQFQNQLERTASPNREESKTQILSATTSDAGNNTSRDEYAVSEIKSHKRGFVIGLMVLLLASIGLSYWFFTSSSSTTKGQIESIAVLPFVNQSGNADNEYLSDGMTETLINNLSQLPNLSVKARSSVFHYKGKAISPQIVGSELSVQAILNGRVVQRGDNLTLSLELVDARTGNQIWGEQYNRKQNDLVALQTEIARDVSQKLRTKLSGADEQRLVKNYTQNTEAYQLYLKGHYHFLKITRPETEKAVSYFQQAIAIDPNYALAYAGLADAYRGLAVAGEMSPAEFMPKAKTAAQKAIEIDDTLADAHAILAFITFWYDWNWNEAENQFKRALELDPENADAHIFYANLHSHLGRHREALARAKRARELDPLNLRINALEGQFLLHAGQTDEALVRLQKTLELDSDYWLARLFIISTYIEKRMYEEAIAESRKARNVYDSTRATSFLSFALAKAGKQAEARAELEGLLKLSDEQWVSPYNVAFIYNGLGETGKTLEWLERGIERRDPRMTFLKVEPKWNNLRSDARYQDLLRRVGFTP